MKEVQIRISTPAELSGAKDVEKSLERQMGAAKALNQDYSAVAQQLEKVRKVIADGTEEIERRKRAATEAAEAERRLVNEYRAPNAAAAGFNGPRRLDVAGDAAAQKAAREAAFLAQFTAAQQRATGATKAHTDATERAAKQTGFFNKEAKESQALLQALSVSGIPGVGLAATAAFSGATAGAAALGLGIAEIVAQVQAAKQEMEDFMALVPAFQRHADASRGLKTALAEARIEAAGFNEDLERMARLQSNVRTEHERTAKALQSQAAAANAAKNAEQDLLDKALEAAVARGLVTKEVAAQIKATMELRQIEAAAAAARKAELEEIAQKEAELAEARVKAQEATGSLPSLREAQAADQAKIQRLEEDLAKARKVADPSGEAQNEFNKKEEVYQKAVKDYADFAGLTDSERQAWFEEIRAQMANKNSRINRDFYENQLRLVEPFLEIEAQRDRLLKSLQDAQALVKSAPGQIEALKIQAASRGKDIAEAEATAKKATGDIGAINEDLTTRRPAFDANEEARRREIEARRRIYSLEFAPPPAPSTGPRTSADAWTKDRGGSAAVPDVSGFAETNGEVIALLRTLLRENEAFKSTVQNLRRQIPPMRPF